MAMPYITMTTITTTAPNPPATPKPPATSTATNSCEVCKTWGRPCPLYTKPAPSPSLIESEWSDEDWGGDRLRECERRKSKQRKRMKTRRRKIVHRKTQNITHLVPYTFPATAMLPQP